MSRDEGHEKGAVRRQAVKMKTIKLSTLKLNDRNPRTIKTEAFERLCKSIERDSEFMKYRPIVCDKARVIIGGNQRYRACVHLGKKEVPENWVCFADDMSEEQRKRFILVDNAPDGMAGEWDWDILGADYNYKELDDLGFGEILRDLADVDAETVERYTQKIVAPVYTPKGMCPSIAELIDRSKTEELQKHIDKKEMHAEIALFLKHAAERHTIFNFGRIAEYYCHANVQTQELMEDSGLVIIDYDKAVECGFVHLTDRLAELADREELGDEDAR